MTSGWRMGAGNRNEAPKRLALPCGTQLLTNCLLVFESEAFFARTGSSTPISSITRLMTSLRQGHDAAQGSHSVDTSPQAVCTIRLRSVSIVNLYCVAA
jgi:hypothetical protein